MGPAGGWGLYLQAVVVATAADLERVMVADGGGSIREILELGHVGVFGAQSFTPAGSPPHCL